MDMEIVEVQPRELKFTFELKKQSSCTVHLVNKSNEYVAFKIKTTSPKRYSVKPNSGVILPRSSCDFTVAMQAMKTAPPDMQLKDKFLVQSIIVPYGSADEDITPGMFSKDNGRYIEEKKLRVFLVSPPQSPVLQQVNRTLNEESTNEFAYVKEASFLKVQAPVSGIENFPPSHVNDVEDLNSKISDYESKLKETEKTIAKLKEEKDIAIQEREKVNEELVMLRKKMDAKVQNGFPFLFVVFMMLVGAWFGHMLHQ